MKTLVFIGADNDQLHFTWRVFYLCYLPTFLGLVMIINGVYISLNSFMEVCHALSVLPILLCAIMKIVTRHTANDITIYLFINDYINNFFETKEIIPVYRQMIIDHVQSLRFWTKAYMGVQLVAYIYPLIFVWILSFDQNDFIYLAFIILPYTDPHTLTGYLINQTIITVQSFVVLLALPFVEVGNLATFISSKSIVKSFCIELSEIAAQLIKDQPLKMVDERKQLEMRIIEVIKKFQEYDNFVKKFNDSVKLYNFALISLNSLGMGPSIIVALKYSLASGASMS